MSNDDPFLIQGDEGNEVEVAPLPEEILNSESTLLISSSEPEVHVKKRDRRRLRHEQWLESKSTCTTKVWSLTCTVMTPYP